jgi:hypothetical protein
VGVSHEEFAVAAGLTSERLQLFEASGSARITAEDDCQAINRGLQHFGIVIVEESDGYGAGVRLKFTRQDTRQIGRWENEGGIVGSDDNP